MKTKLLPLLVSTLLVTFPSLAQDRPSGERDADLNRIIRGDLALPPPDLTTFDLKFPGGTPRELVAAIEKAMGKPVNVIIPSEHHSIPLPEFEVHGVKLPQLLNAIGQASRETSDYQYGFLTADKVPSDTSIWTFHAQVRPKPGRRPPEISKERFRSLYQLAPYLEVFKVEDITTAIETAWAMKSVGPGSPAMKFHQDTQLLIMLGTNEERAVVEQVLSQLKERLPKPAVDPQTGLPLPQRRITN